MLSIEKSMEFKIVFSLMIMTAWLCFQIILSFMRICPMGQMAGGNALR